MYYCLVGIRYTVEWAVNRDVLAMEQLDEPVGDEHVVVVLGEQALENVTIIDAVSDI